MKQAWKSLKRKIFKPVVFFLDNATFAERKFIIRHINPTLNGMDLDDVLSQPRLVVTNLSRYGERLDYFLVRYSRCNPHFYSRDCYKGAIVYGESDYIGNTIDIEVPSTMCLREDYNSFMDRYVTVKYLEPTATEIMQRNKTNIGGL